MRAGAISLLAVAVGIPLAAGAAAQPFVVGKTATPATEVAAQSSALAKRIPKAKIVRHAKAKPATPVTTAAPKPVVTAAPKPVVTAAPKPRYVAPKPRYVAPKPRYVAPKPRYVAPKPRYVAPVQVQSSGRCGGNLPPCYVMMRESKGQLTAKNPTSTASGKWQFLNSTWQGYGGYPTAASAPESVQDARAAQVWAGGSGCSNWSAC